MNWKGKAMAKVIAIVNQKDEVMIVKVLDPRVTQEHRSGARISFAIEQDQLTAAKLLADKLREGTISLECKKWRNRRSLDANAYMWKLVDKIAEKTRQKPADVYRHAIKEIPGNSVIVCVQNKAKDAVQAGWQKNGIEEETEKTLRKRAARVPTGTAQPLALVRAYCFSVMLGSNPASGQRKRPPIEHELRTSPAAVLSIFS